ncbi:hypothetical protein DKG77_03205 [Flagellimonas aquimarina]|uniref:Uncharacterized protein n=1 Tax=Flagellimonas aquimarina TaxID=2201895 RepID=A0A316L1Z7_9FLAO|nr:hypothetical protein [Allomuricauda koreensis]PWL39851.1 hypothetical protein DKG77_03205 [Allomuricauda koreensis]
MYKIGILIQARLGSSRLPKKIVLPFYDDKSILDILLEKFDQLKKRYPVILTTPNNSEDNILENYASKHQIDFYRGSESDVLKRFIDTARFYEIDVIVRVCSDNPFLDIDHITDLIEIYDKNKLLDYCSYKDNKGVPVIKTHIGLFAEIVTLAALEKTHKETQDIIYREHVTNYIYSHPQKFKIHLKNAFPEVFCRKDLRFTIDDIDDFENLSELYGKYIEMDSNIFKTIEHIDCNPFYKLPMIKNIKKYSK